MMFKEKSFGAAPPFLQLDDSDSEAEKEDHTNDIANIKTEPSNSAESTQHASEATSNDSNCVTKAIKKEKKKCIEDGASDISSDDEVLGSPKGGIKIEDDKMSLSSLSSTEDKVKTAIGDAAMHAGAVPQVSDYYYPSSTNPYYYPNGEQSAYDPYQSQYMSSHGYMQQYMAGFPALIPGNYVQSDRNEEAVVPQTNQDPSEEIISAVIERVKTELKQILIKDINKRMTESIAYKKYDAWWDEQIRNENSKKSITTAA